MTSSQFDLAVVGSAFGGSILAMIARRLGRSVILIERHRHPRFAIGESSTPLTNLLLEALATTYDLPQLGTFAKWGSWQRTHPTVAGGLKRGFSFFHHQFNQGWKPQPGRANELLVAASPEDEIADTHWYRPDFDAFWVAQAQALGVTYVDETELDEFKESSEGIYLRGIRASQPFVVHASFVVDASGPRGFLSRRLGLGETPFPNYPATQALFTHFTGVSRWEDLHPPSGAPPFPLDDAALHHVFPGGWMWVLRFNNGITSAGVSLNASLGEELELSDGAAAWARLLARLPSVAEQFQNARPLRPFSVLPRLSFHCSRITGSRWALLPSAAGFVDPLLSTGFPLTLLGIERLAQSLKKTSVPSQKSLNDYAQATSADLNVVAELVGALFHNLGRPQVFQSLTMLYFSAASFAETARRLGRHELAQGFLLRERPDFRNAITRLCSTARNTNVIAQEFTTAVSNAIAPVDIVGWQQAAKQNWYGIDLEYLVNSRAKLGASAADIDTMLYRSGLLPRQRV